MLYIKIYIIHTKNRYRNSYIVNKSPYNYFKSIAFLAIGCYIEHKLLQTQKAASSNNKAPLHFRPASRHHRFSNG